jgi:hypothetical protein
MKTLILAAGRFDDELKAQIADDREPRLDIFELATRLGADFVDFRAADQSRVLEVRAHAERLVHRQPSRTSVGKWATVRCSLQRRTSAFRWRLS